MLKGINLVLAQGFPRTERLHLYQMGLRPAQGKEDLPHIPQWKPTSTKLAKTYICKINNWKPAYIHRKFLALTMPWLAIQAAIISCISSHRPHLVEA